MQKTKVEEWKMPEGVGKFLGVYRRTFALAQKLHGEMKQKMSEAMVLRGALGQTEGQLQQLLAQAPSMEPRELPMQGEQK